MQIKQQGPTFTDVTTGQALELNRRYPITGYDGHTFQIMQAGSNFVLMIKAGKRTVQSATLPKWQNTTCDLRPDRDPFPLGRLIAEHRRNITAAAPAAELVMAEGDYTTRPVTPNAWRVVTDGTFSTHRGAVPDSGAMAPCVSYTFSNATYALAISSYNDDIRMVIVWDGVDIDALVKVMREA